MAARSTPGRLPRLPNPLLRRKQVLLRHCFLDQRSRHVGRNLPPRKLMPCTDRYYFLVGPLELADRSILVEILRDCLARSMTETGVELGRTGQRNHRLGEVVPVLLFAEIAVNVFRYRLRDSAVTSRDHRQTGCHRFENRIWNPFLVFVSRCLARVNKKMRLMIERSQIFLAEKTAELNPVRNVETLGQCLQLRLEWSFACNHKLRLRELD